ncbi:MAG: DUF2155 domain-containing protein [Terricaulis sp.]
MMRILFAALAFFAAAAAPAYAERAVLRGLDKVTGHARDFSATLGRPVRFGTLEVVARSCSKRAPEETPEVSVYVEVFDHPPVAEGAAAERVEIFHGWIFASSPGLSAIEHPNYDIWAIDCRE